MINTGTRLADRYEIVKTLGGGGMAVVYQAIDLVLDRTVAIKVMKEDLRNHKESIQRFLREAKAAGSLLHPNVVNMFDIGREGTTYYMVMEYVEGITLADYVEQKGPLMSNEAIDIIIQVCDGLMHAHKNGIIHRDIKAQNIMRTPDRRYKVTDFGISYFSNMTTSLTQTGTVMGSAHYLSPEQASGKKVTYTSDLYAVGVLLFLLVTGRFPFDGDSSVAIALKHLREPLPDPRKLNPLISEELCQIIQKAMDKNPAKRFQTAEELKKALEAIRSGKENRDESKNKPNYRFAKTKSMTMNELSTSTIPSRHEKYRRKNQAKRQRKWILYSISAVVVILFVGLTYYLVWGNESDPAPKSPVKKTVDKKPEKKQPEQTTPIKTDLEGSHPWWKELPKKEYLENDVFKDIQVTGKDGKYDISLLVGKIPEKSFYYNIYVVDRFSSRLILNGQNVPVVLDAESEYTLKEFQVSIPEPLLPKTGILKIEIYWKNDEKAKADPTDNLLQQWGEVPEEQPD